jgi:hypothetical protein
MSEQKQMELVDNIFSSWNGGETSNELAIRQLAKIAEVTSYREGKINAIASLETVKENS